MATQNLRDVGTRVEELLGELHSGDTRAAERADELVRLLVELYGAGLERVMEAVSQRGGPALVDELAGDPLVASLLVLHGLHPVPAEQRVSDAVEAVRRHVGPVKLLGVDDDLVVHVEMDAGCGSGCGALQARGAVEEAVRDAAPEVVRVEFAAASRPVPVTLGVAGNGRPVPVTIGPARR